MEENGGKMNPWEPLGMTEEQFRCKHGTWLPTGKEGWMRVTKDEEHLYPTSKCADCGLVVFNASESPKQTRKMQETPVEPEVLVASGDE